MFGMTKHGASRLTWNSSLTKFSRAFLADGVVIWEALC